MKQKVIAIIPAAGAGRRFGHRMNKAFYEILGKPILIWVLGCFQDSRVISEIIPVLSETDMEKGLALIEEYGISKVKKIAPGGRERQDSVYHALKLVADRSATVIIHDGVRPLINDELIRRAVEALGKHDGAVCAVKVKDTIKETEGDRVTRTLERKNLVAVQTPQVFRARTLTAAYEKIKESGMNFTDDAAVVEYAGGKIVTVDGAYTNIKVTTPEDALVAEVFLKARQRV